MPFPFTDLPYSKDALEPYISAETMTFHHDKHYKNYVTKLNELTLISDIANDSLVEVMRNTHKTNKAIFQNAAQAWNHEFYWKCLSPEKLEPSAKLLEALEDSFGSAQGFKNKFSEAALKHFGSGWIWVVRTPSGTVEIKALENAENPLTSNEVPLLVCDVWEHAYYLDYKNERAKYVLGFWRILNWKFFEKNLQDSTAPEHLRMKPEIQNTLVPNGSLKLKPDHSVSH